MKYTNQLNLPDFVCHALQNSDYVPADQPNPISVTTLIKPPHIIQLEKKYYDEIEIDYKDLMWSMLGQIGHAIVSRLDGFKNIDNYSVETRIGEIVEYTNRFGKTESAYFNGQYDIFDIPNGILYDNKFTTHYSVLNNKPKEEWVEQLNLLAWLLRRKGYTVNQLKIVAWLRDLTAADKFKYDKPDNDIVIVDIPMWTDEETTSFLIDRLRYHSVESTGCTEAERWAKKPKYAVIKIGGTKALKLYDSMDDAYNNRRDGYTVEYRPGSDGRCQYYCNVNKFCSYYQEKYGKKHGTN